MSAHTNDTPDKTKETKLPAADTGNVSNPSPHDERTTPAGTGKLLNEKAEKYLRESGNIEDMPDEQDWQEADKTIREENRSQ